MTSGALGLLGNEPWRVAAKEDSMRSFVRRPGVRGAVLHVAVHVTVGVNVATMDADIDGFVLRLGTERSLRAPRHP